MDDLVARAHALLEENQYLTLATADASGRPWSTTVWYTAWQRSRSSTRLAVELVWLSRPEALHSRNLTQRPEVGISIFNSAQPAGTGDGLQFAAHAELVPSALLDDAAAAFSAASVAAGGGTWTRAQVEEPSVPRLYIARIRSAFLLGNATRVEVPLA
ncbi:pyridoxamine 5'-phosphate oxidase family protein [Nocardioides sp. CGMCC 1.13656]|nr:MULTISPECIES: pyridoxamine 5'-phosphate oxidase family protein [unclassified Nocardioides]MBA2954723.1 pyridoxamine 5'-phosphate oxidase family protein [Nocardioides sp. CGMCC 1.13656]